MQTFSERVVAAALSVPKGNVTTYGRIARAAGGGGQAARSVSTILGHALACGEHRIPWHRIVYANGRIWIDVRHRKERMRLYKKEGMAIDKKDRVQNFRNVLFEFE